MQQTSITTNASAATTAQGRQFDVYRAKFFAFGWTREKIATITAADEGEAHAICKRDLRPEFDGTSHTNTMMGDLRVFPAGERVETSGRWSAETRNKRRRQLFS